MYASFEVDDAAECLLNGVCFGRGAMQTIYLFLVQFKFFCHSPRALTKIYGYFFVHLLHNANASVVLMSRSMISIIIVVYKHRLKHRINI